MMVFKRKQIVALSLVVMIIIAGYLQYTYNKSSTASSKSDSKLGEAVYVDNDGNKVQNTSNKKAKTTASSTDYFIQTRLNREMAREKGIEAMEQITQDVNASDEVKAKAYEKIMQLKANSEKEARIEALLQEQGYEDVVVLFADDESVDVYVKADSLTQSQSTQIAETVSRQGNVDMTNIYIKNVS